MTAHRHRSDGDDWTLVGANRFQSSRIALRITSESTGRLQLSCPYVVKHPATSCKRCERLVSTMEVNTDAPDGDGCSGLFPSGDIAPLARAVLFLVVRKRGPLGELKHARAAVPKKSQPWCYAPSRQEELSRMIGFNPEHPCNPPS